MDKVVLNNGVELPRLCYGTGIVHDYRYGRYINLRKIKYFTTNLIRDYKRFSTDISFSKVVNMAMKNGCNMFDTSRAYGGAEYILGKTLKKYNRSDYYIVTKLCNADQFNRSVRKGFERSLNELGVDYIDLYLMHWPVTDYYLQSWQEIERLYEEGLIKAIGVCNCNIHHLEEMKKNVNIMPMVNQIECHPLFTQNELRNYCTENQIQVMAYTATARMNERLLKTCLVPIADKYKKTVAQIIIKWHLQIGNIPVVNSSKVKHLYENTDIRDFVLTEDEIKQISAININSRLRYDPDNCDFKQL